MCDFHRCPRHTHGTTQGGRNFGALTVNAGDSASPLWVKSRHVLQEPMSALGQKRTFWHVDMNCADPGCWHPTAINLLRCRATIASKPDRWALGQKSFKPPTQDARSGNTV